MWRGNDAQAVIFSCIGVIGIGFIRVYASGAQWNIAIAAEPSGGLGEPSLWRFTDIT